MQGGYPSGSYPPDPNVPQPPDQQTQTLYPQAQQAPGPTLGQANGDPSGLPPGNPIIDQYNQAIGSTLDLLQQRGYIQQPIPPPPAENPALRLLKGIGTFGISELNHIANENTRREQNYVIHKENQATAMKGVDLATRMVDAQATAAGLAGRASLGAARLDLEQKRYIADLEQKLFTRGRMKVNDELKQDYIPAPMGADAIDAATAQGYHPSIRFGSSWTRNAEDGGDAGGGGGGGGVSPRLTKNQTTGAWEPPKPGSAADKAVAAVGGSDTGGAASGSGDLPTQLRQRKAAAAGAAAGATEKAKNAAALTASIGQLRGELETMRTAAQQVLPSIGEGGIARGLATKYVSGPVSLLHAQYSKDPKMRDAAKTLASSARNIFNLIKSEAGGTSGLRITNAEIQQFGKQFNDIAAGKTSIEDAHTYIQNLSDFLDRRDPGKGADVNAATTDTPTSGGGPPSSLGGTQPTAPTGVTPGGIRFRVVP